jgi:hypothetical protein
VSRISHAARLERLKRALRGDPEVRVQMAPHLFELCAGRSLSEAEVAQLNRLDLPEQWARLQLLRRTSEPGR